MMMMKLKMTLTINLAVNWTMNMVINLIMTLKIKTVLTFLKSTKNEVTKWKVNRKVNGKHINTIFSPKN